MIRDHISAIFSFVLLIVGPHAWADELAARPNVKQRTLGGAQFWTDQLHVQGWRIQRNVLTKTSRVLDGDDVRHAWGTSEQCAVAFDRIRQQRNLKPAAGKVVIALHGLVRTRRSMDGLCEFLDKKGGFTTINMSYASARDSIENHAKALASVVDGLDPAAEIYLVAHSMGNLVIRHFLADLPRTDPRLRRIVMLTPPNHGSAIAERFQKTLIFKLVWGESGEQIANWAKLEKRLATPSCQFGIIAGGRNDADGLNPLINGDDDFVVTVAETRLAGAHDFEVLPVYHGSIMFDERVREHTLRFFQHGHFVSAAKRQPIP